MTTRLRPALALVFVSLLALPLPAADWPQWGGTDGKNMAADETGLPASFIPGEKDTQTGTVNLATARHVRWARKVCQVIYATPVISQGRIVICGGEYDGKGDVTCLDERTGNELWQWRGGTFDHNFGICCTPIIDAGRVYVVTHNCVALCLDINGEPDDKGRLKPRVLWQCDMQKEFKTLPADTYCGSSVIDGDLIYTPTSNGIDPLAPGAKERMFALDKKYKGGRLISTDEASYRVPSPEAPNLVVFDKRTGRVVATDDAPITKTLLKGQWSSCSLATIGGRKLVFYGGGDGLCYAFEALAGVPEQPTKLKTVWTFDCIPEEYKDFGGMPRIVHYYHGDSRWGGALNQNDGRYKGLAEIIGTPVVYKDRVYVAIGRDAAMGRGRGALHCIDATKTGDITQSGKIWTYQGLDWTPSTVSIAGGLLYIADMAGRLHCLDAENGQCHWVYENNCGMLLGSTLAVDGKVYMPANKGLYVFAASTRPRLLDRINVGAPIYATPVAANGTLYIASHKGWLWAVR